MSNDRPPLTKVGQFFYNLTMGWAKLILRHRWIYWILTFTWAIVSTVVGLLLSLVLICCGKKPHAYHGVWYFEVGSGWGGLTIGPCFLIGDDCHDCSAHEFGHMIGQVTLFGPFWFMIMAASGARYWYRELKYYRKGTRPPTGYDDVWFERAATDAGDLVVIGSPNN